MRLNQHPARDHNVVTHSNALSLLDRITRERNMTEGHDPSSMVSLVNELTLLQINEIKRAEKRLNQSNQDDIYGRNNVSLPQGRSEQIKVKRTNKYGSRYRKGDKNKNPLDKNRNARISINMNSIETYNRDFVDPPRHIPQLSPKGPAPVSVIEAF